MISNVKIKPRHPLPQGEIKTNIRSKRPLRAEKNTNPSKKKKTVRQKKSEKPAFMQEGKSRGITKGSSVSKGRRMPPREKALKKTILNFSTEKKIHRSLRGDLTLVFVVTGKGEGGENSPGKGRL